MKKISLLTLLSVMTFAGASNANVENPLYIPKEGGVVVKGEFALGDGFWGLGGSVGYGITKKFSMDIGLDYYDTTGLDGVSVNGIYRLTNTSLITDVYAGLEFGDDTTVNGGVRVGKQNKGWTFAANAGLMFNSVMTVEAGADLVKQFSGNWKEWSLQAAADLYLVDVLDNLNTNVDLTAQVNYQKGGLWSLFYTANVEGASADRFGIKYGTQF